MASKSAVIVGNNGTPSGGVATTKGQPAPTPQIPFTRASMEHVESFVDSSAAVTTSTTAITGGPVSVPAYGFMASILLFCSGTLGAGGSAVAKEDAPWSALERVELMDVNGASIVSLTGFELFLANKFGGYGWAADPASHPFYSAVSSNGNFAFALRIPVQIGRRDALGCLPNSNSSSTYQLRITQAASTSIFSTNPATTLPTLRWRAFLEAWAQPPSQGIGGGINAVQPPALGTTQFWSSSQLGLAAGSQRVKLPRIGNMIRNIILVNRATSDGLRSTGESAFPLDFGMEWDAHVVFNESSDVAKYQTYERYGYSPGNGVRVIDYAHDFSGHPGDGEYRDLWLPTTGSSRVEFTGSWVAASNLTVIVNDVAPVGQVFL